jgi:lysophospholipase L1-like esterase
LFTPLQNTFKVGRYRILFINLITVLAILALIELSARFILHNIYQRNFDSLLIINNKYGNSDGLRENATGSVWGKQLHTDPFAGRVNKGKPQASKKWIYLGDSVTEGVGVSDSETFCSLVSQTSDSFTFINPSLIGYSTADYLNVLQAYLTRYSDISHVTMFYCLNDVYGTAKSKDLPVMAKQNMAGRLNTYLTANCATYKLIKLYFYQNSNRYYLYDAAFYKPGNQNFTEAMEYLRQCANLCASKHILFNVVLLPYRSQLNAKKNQYEPQQMVLGFCKENHIECTDISGHLSSIQPASLYLFADEIHFSADGHKAITKALQ